jgi:hypothetical protein
VSGKINYLLVCSVSVELLLLIVMAWAIISHQKSGRLIPKKVRVEHVREPLVAALNFIAICTALVAAIIAYGTVNELSKTINFLILSMLDFLVAGIVAIYFLFSLPNLAGDDETISYSFETSWDVVVVPNIVLVLVIFGVISLGVYGFYECYFTPQTTNETTSWQINMCWGQH